MDTSKFNCMEMALMAATTAFMAAVKMGKYCNLSGGVEVSQFTLDVHLDTDELFTLPSGYVYSGIEEKTYTSPLLDCPPFKNKKYYFTF